MEAIMIAGLAAVVAGGIYSVLDMLADLGIGSPKKEPKTCESNVACGGDFGNHSAQLF